jgi:hypothetical protein
VNQHKRCQASTSVRSVVETRLDLNLDDSGDASLEQLVLADALVHGRKTYESLAAVWPQLASDPTMGRFADRINGMPKYVASRTLNEPLEWNATLIKGDVDQAIPALKAEHSGNLIGAESSRTLLPNLVSSTSSGPGPPPPLGNRPSDLRRRRPGSARAGGVYTVPFESTVAALPACHRLTERAGWRSRQTPNGYGAAAADQRARDGHHRLSPGDGLG